MLNTRYRIQVYAPSDREAPCVILESPMPFLAINRGDIINPRGFDSSKWPEVEALTGKVLVVRRVEHIFAETMTTRLHTIMLYTGAADDSEEMRG